MTILKLIEGELQGIALPTVTRPPIDFDKPDEELTLFAMRLYAYSVIAHIRTILTGAIVLAEAGNTPSAELLSRHVFEWTALDAYIAETVEPHLKQKTWKDAFRVVADFDRANSWIKKHGNKHGAAQIQLDAPDAVRMKNWINAYERYRTAQYNGSSVNDAYGFLSEHAHPSASCLLQYRDIMGTDIRFVPSTKAHLPDLDHCLLDWLMLHYKILGLAQEDMVRVQMLKVMEKVAAVAKKK